MTLFLDWIYSIAQFLDHLRSQLLRTSSKLPKFRIIFCNRPLRLGLIFIFATAMFLFCSLLFPVWVLALGPILYGIPHLVSSLRYCHYVLRDRAGNTNSQLKGSFLFSSVAFLSLVAALRFMSDSHLIPFSYYPELFSLFITILVLAMIYKKKKSLVFFGWIVLAPFAVYFVKAPLTVIGALLLVHNFIAFIYWIRGAQSRIDLVVSITSTVITLLITGLILSGSFDILLARFQPLTLLPFANIDLTDQGQQIFPWSSDPLLAYRAAIAYAFGQSLHYFVWLKIIPDQYHYHSTPTSFRQGLHLLEIDFGKLGLFLIFVSIFGFLGIWSLVSLPMARMIYFSVASYHGYLEIGGLLLAARNSKLNGFHAMSPTCFSQ